MLTREELIAAHDHFVEVAGRCAAQQQWREWADLFSSDATYYEHVFGKFNGPDEIYAWIQPLMEGFPNVEMRSFPHEWCVFDEARGWSICWIQNRFDDPGDGVIYQAPNCTILHFGDDGKVTHEEDVYNPMTFAPIVTSFMEAYAKHHPETPAGAK